MAPEVVKVKVEPLTEEGIKPYGHILQQKQPLFPEVDPGEGRIAMEFIRLKRSSKGPQADQLQLHQSTGSNRVEDMAIHYSYNQTFIPLKGSMVLVLAPAPPKVGKTEADYPLDYSKVKAFVIHPGEGAIIDKGVWHGSILPGSVCELINVTRKDAGEKTSDQFTHPSQRGYVEIVEVMKRDNKVIELEF